MLNEYFQSVQNHRKLVFEIGQVMRVPLGQLTQHDMSKFSDEEFIPYAEKFYGKGHHNLFKRAWLHHVNNNPHHWEYWCLVDKLREMPLCYVREMVADRQAMEIQHHYKIDMSEWLNKNVPEMKLHPTTMTRLLDVLRMQAGYPVNIGCEFYYDESISNAPEISSIAHLYWGG